MKRWVGKIFGFDEEEGAGRKIEQLVESAAEQGMPFYAELGQWEVGKITIEYTVEELAEKVAKQKREAAPPMN